MISPNLFGDAAPNVAPRDTALDVRMGPLLLTNAPNLYHFLSLGYVGPFKSFGNEDKYYGDLLHDAPGRLPLLFAPLSSDLIEYVCRESRRSARPVILEFYPEAMPLEDVPSLDVGGNPTEGPAASSGFIATAPAVVLPFAAVRRVIFISEEDRDEVLARSFENVPPIPAELAAVLPEVVGDDGLNLKSALPWLGDLPQPAQVSCESFRQADRVAGAVALAVHSRHDLEGALLTLLQAGTPGSELPNWFGLLAAGSTHEAPRDPDGLTFAATVSVLHSTSLKEWRPKEVLEKVWERISSNGLSPDEMDQLEKGVDRILRILNNDEDFTTSRSQRYPALQGLMLLLIRKDPIQLLAWDPEETQAGALAHLTAALYAGLLHGRARLPQTLREQDTDDRIAEIVARRLSPLPLPQLPPTRMWRGKRGQPVQRDLVTLLLEADLNADGPYRRAALEVCAAMDWRDCVTSVLICPNDDTLTMDYVVQKRKVVRFRVPGFAELHHELDASRFRERVVGLDLSHRRLKIVLNNVKQVSE